MAAIGKVGSVHLDGSVYSGGGVPDGFAPVDIGNRGGYKVGPFVAGEAIAPGDAVQIASDGTVMRAVASSAQGGRVHGFASFGAASGAQVYLYSQVILVYGNALTPGSPVFLSASNAGQLDTVTSTNAPQPIGYVLPDGKRVFVRASAY